MSARNVLLITIDSLRADRVLERRDGVPLAPNFCSLRNSSATFDEAVANGPATISSFPSILTSTLPLMYGGYSYLDDSRPFLARTLQRSGFKTVGFHSNPHLGSKQNYDTGFETFNDSAEGADSVASLKDRVERRLDPDSRIYSLLRRLWHYFTLTTDTSAYAKAPTITENATEWFENELSRDDQFFMWLHYMDVHYPFAPPERYLDDLGIDPLPKQRVAELNGKMQEDPGSLTDGDIDDLLKLYDGEIRYTDHYIGKVIEKLESLDVLDETIVVITADHGEAFGEHGRFGHHPFLYDELLRVPLLIQASDIDPQTVDKQVSLLDLGPTLYDLLGVETPPAVQGTSFEPLLREQEWEEDVAIITGKGGDTLACRTSQWKCFWKVEKNEVELYDLQSDPEELTDVSAANMDIVDKFQGIMQNYLDEAKETDIVLPNTEESPEVQQRLRNLGYRD